MAETKIEEKKVKISWDGKQMKVGIPSEFVEELEINQEKDKILWVLIEDEKGASLIGKLTRE